MGKYINSDSKGNLLGSDFDSKVSGLLADGATSINQPTVFEPGLVCVVDNLFFAAAGYAYSESEMQCFSRLWKN